MNWIFELIEQLTCGGQEKVFRINNIRLVVKTLFSHIFNQIYSLLLNEKLFGASSYYSSLSCRAIFACLLVLIFILFTDVKPATAIFSIWGLERIFLFSLIRLSQSLFELDCSNLIVLLNYCLCILTLSLGHSTHLSLLDQGVWSQGFFIFSDLVIHAALIYSCFIGKAKNTFVQVFDHIELTFFFFNRKPSLILFNHIGKIKLGCFIVMSTFEKLLLIVA